MNIRSGNSFAGSDFLVDQTFCVYAVLLLTECISTGICIKQRVECQTVMALLAYLFWVYVIAAPSRRTSVNNTYAEWQSPPTIILRWRSRRSVQMFNCSKQRAEVTA